MQKRNTYLLIGIFLALQGFSLYQLSGLRNSLEQAQGTLSSLQGNVQQQVGRITSQIRSELEQQASPLHRAELSIGALRTEDYTVPVTFTVLPKQVDDALTVALSFAGERLPLERQENVFSGTKNFPLSTTGILPDVILIRGEQEEITASPELQINQLRQQFLPEWSPWFHGGWGSGTDGLNFDGSIDFSDRTTMVNNPFVSLRYLEMVDGVVQKEEILPIKNVVASFPVKGQYPLTHGQKFTSVVEAKDGLGFTYRYLIFEYIAGQAEQRDPYWRQETITAPDGTVLFFYDAWEEENHG